MDMPTLVALMVRHAATGFAGYLISRGLIDASMQEAVVGAVITVGTVGWSMWNKVGRARLETEVTRLRKFHDDIGGSPHA